MGGHEAGGLSWKQELLPHRLLGSSKVTLESEEEDDELQEKVSAIDQKGVSILLNLPLKCALAVRLLHMLLPGRE